MSLPKNRGIKIKRTANGREFDQGWQPGPRAALALKKGVKDDYVLLVRLS